MPASPTATKPMLLRERASAVPLLTSLRDHVGPRGSQCRAVAWVLGLIGALAAWPTATLDAQQPQTIGLSSTRVLGFGVADVDGEFGNRHFRPIVAGATTDATLSGYRAGVELTYTPKIQRYPSTTVPANMRQSRSYTIQNVGNATATYTLVASCSGAVTMCNFGYLASSPTIITRSLPPGYSSSFSAYYTPGDVGTTGQFRITMTAPPRASGLVESDTSNLNLTAADVYSPGISFQPFGEVGDDGERWVGDTASIVVDFYDADGTIQTSTLTREGTPVTASSVVSSSTAGMHSDRLVTFPVRFLDGYGSVTATVWDGYHTFSQVQGYAHDGASANLATVTAVHPTFNVTPYLATVDSFLVANPGPQTAMYGMGLQCNPAGSCSMSPAVSSITLASGESKFVKVQFTSGPAGTHTTTTLTLTYVGAFRTLSRVASFTADVGTTTSPSILVTPHNDTTVTSSPITQVRIDWCDPDDALVLHDVTWQGQALPNTYVSATRAGCYSAGTSTYNNLAINPWRQTLVATARDAANHTTTSTTTMTFSAPLTTFAPHVTATSEIHRLPSGASSTVADTFTVANAGSNAAGYALAVGCGARGTLSSCTLSPASLSLAPGASAPVIVQYTRSGASDVIDTLTLNATYTSPLSGVIADTGRKPVVAPSVEAAAAIAPMQSLFQVPPRVTMGQAWFSVRNTSSVPETFTLYLVASSGWGFMTTSVTPTLTMTVQVAPGQTQYVSPGVVTPLTTGVSGTISLTVSYLNTAGQSLSGTAVTQLITADPSSPGTIALSVTGTAPILVPNASRTATFTVRNTSTTSGTVTFTRACAGAVIVSCATPSPSSATLAGGASITVNVDVTAGATAGQGTVTLTATSGSVTSSASIAVATGIVNGPIAIGVASQLNPGTAISRDQCVTIAAGDDAAYECGDLRLVHALPTTTTMNKARTPTLIYTSAHAHPVALVAVDVTLNGASSLLGGTCPNQITARLRFANSDTAERAIPWTGPCGQLATRRVVVPVNAQSHSLTTGIYTYTLEVTLAANGSSWTASDSSGVLAVVNRSGSQFGAGWWIDGVEELSMVPGRTDQLFWIGGDGSTRLYTQVGSTNVFMVSPTLDRPDSIVKVSDTDYRRRLRNGAYVQFGPFMLHSATVNALGHTTQFVWDTATKQLRSIVLPVPSGSSAVPTYAFSYTSNLLTSVTAPPGPNGARVTTLSRSGGDLSVIDPGALAVHYVADASNRIITRTNRLGDATRFDFDAAASVLTYSLADMSRTNPVADSIALKFCPAEAASLAACANGATDPQFVRTLFDGPRLTSDVADTTAFSVTRFGAPARVVDAIGHATTIERTDLRWPLLATATVQTNGHRVEASYTDRGLTQETRDISPLGALDTAKTQYQWDATFDKVSVITTPTGVSSYFGYFANGDRQWEQPGPSQTRRVSFGYDASTRLLTSITPPAPLGTTRYEHDARGNLSAVVSAIGFRTEMHRDAIGRDSIVTSPIDSAQTQHRTRSYVYDVADRLQSSVDSALSGSTVEAIRIRNNYDAEGRATAVSRSVSPDTNHIGWVTDSSIYDAAGRVTQKIGAALVTMHYDAAGNRVSTNRGDVNVYDRLNRLTQHQLPRIDADVSNPGWAMDEPTGAPAETERLSYDDMGRLIAADNQYAQIRRGYYPNGLLRGDTVLVRDYGAAAGVFGTTAALRFAYNLGGQRTKMWHNRVSLGQLTDSVTYLYDASTGALQQVVDPQGYGFTYDDDAAGQLHTLTFPAGAAVDTWDYDADGRLRARNTTDVVRRDARGLALSRTLGTIAAESYQFTYAALGSLKSSVKGLNTSLLRDEEFNPDGFGNSPTNDLVGSPSETGSWRRTYDPGTGVIVSATKYRDQDPYLGLYMPETSYLYDSNGDQIESRHYSYALRNLGTGTSCPNCGQAVTDSTVQRQTYDANARLRYVRTITRRTFSSGDSVTVATTEYRYDALGRRLMTRYRGPISCEFQSNPTCRATLLHQFWDGSALLAESQESDPQNAGPGTTGWDGDVVYTHGRELDVPLSILRRSPSTSCTFTVFPHTDFRGQLASGTFGGLQPACARVDWPAVSTRVFRLLSSSASAPWNGSLLSMGGDATGLQYMRNRYYDPATGQFTQGDPIGLAGGMNLYGFAGGDPVNFSDPFGLCKDANGVDRSGDFCPGGQGLKGPGLLDPIAWLSGGITIGIERGLAALGARAIGSAGSRVAANKIAGDAFRDEIADAFESNGYGVSKEVAKKTPFGRRVIDVEVSKDGEVLGGVEAKAGKSRYLPWQRAKDEYLRRAGYPVQVVRDATVVKAGGIPK